MRTLLLLLIKSYRLLISPWLGNHCRFTPSCSHYAMTAIQRHGALRGSYLAVKRVARCHPWHAGGYDPVPEAHYCQTTQTKQTSENSHG